MNRLRLTLCVAVALAVAAPAWSQDKLPPGQGRDVLAVACSQCHALDVITSMREGPAGWRRHVTNMVLRGAQLTSREVDAVVQYLVANFGPGGEPASKAATATLPAGAGKDLVEARCTGCHDLERVATIKRQKAEWPVVVANMVGRGATATPEEARSIASYLAAQFGSD